MLAAISVFLVPPGTLPSVSAGRGRRARPSSPVHSLSFPLTSVDSVLTFLDSVLTPLDSVLTSLTCLTLVLRNAYAVELTPSVSPAVGSQ